MWQSLVEIRHYSIVYFDCVTASIKGGTYMRCIDVSGISAPTCAMSPALNKSSALYSTSNAVTQLKYTME